MKIDLVMQFGVSGLSVSGTLQSVALPDHANDSRPSQEAATWSLSRMFRSLPI